MCAIIASVEVGILQLKLLLMMLLLLRLLVVVVAASIVDVAAVAVDLVLEMVVVVARGGQDAFCESFFAVREAADGSGAATRAEAACAERTVVLDSAGFAGLAEGGEGRGAGEDADVGGVVGRVMRGRGRWGRGREEDLGIRRDAAASGGGGGGAGVVVVVGHAVLGGQGGQGESMLKRWKFEGKHVDPEEKKATPKECDWRARRGVLDGGGGIGLWVRKIL
jgi:hypothetical protein